MPKRFLVLLLGVLSSACVYRINIQQGNFLDQAAVEQVKPGMTRSQVRYLLGTPMVPDVFDKDRWDYLYYFQRGRLHRPVERRVVVYFKDDKVTNFERLNVPDSVPEAPEQGAPIEKFPRI